MGYQGDILIDGQLSGTISIGEASVDKRYEGVYSVTPKPFNRQELNTKNKFLKENVVIEAIPYYQVTNDQNGITVNIGG